MAEKSDANRLIPPTGTFRSVIGFVDSLRRGIPDHIDRSLMRTMSGSTQVQVLAAMRYLQLVDSQGNAQNNLARLVNSEGEERVEVLRDLLKLAYPFLFNGFDLTKTTSIQYREKLREAGASGDSIRKAAAFFLAAAKEAQIEVSPYIAETVRPQVDARQRKPRPTTGKAKTPPKQDQQDENRNTSPQMTWEQMLLSKFPTFDPAWDPHVQKEWFASYREMMRMKKELQSEQHEVEDDMADDQMDEV